MQAKASHEIQLLKQPRAVCKLGGVESQGVNRVITSLMQIQTRGPPAPADYVRGGLNTETMVTLTLKPHNSVSLCMTLVPSELLSLRWSSGCMLVSKGVL